MNTMMQTNQKPDLLIVKDLVKYFPVRGGLLQRTVAQVQAVDKVSFTVRNGETLGLVGESGCGKTTVGRSILRLIEPTSGEVTFDGENMITMRSGSLKAMRRNMQIIFQDPYASLNPRWTVSALVSEPLRVHRLLPEKERAERVRELLRLVGLSPSQLNRFPHEFSGGQRQRIGIARALALNPKFIVCDEPIAALDVSIQAQVVNLLEDLQAKFGLTYLFISHDLSVVRSITDRVMVMQAGRIVESGPTEAVFANPSHAYTRTLIAAAPILPDNTVLPEITEP